MYRLISKHRVVFHRPLTVPSKPIMQLSAQMCTYCNFHHRKLIKSIMYTQTRSRITLNPTLSPNQIAMKKKVKGKKYAELLEISNHVTSRRAAIKKLNASDVSILVDQPDITMDKLHRLKDFDYSKQATVHSTKIPADIKHGSGQQEYTAISNLSQHLYEKMSKVQGLNSLDRKNKSVKISKTIEKLQGIIDANNSLYRGQVFSKMNKTNDNAIRSSDYPKTLAAYVDVYLAVENINLAARTLLHYRKKNAQTTHKDAVIIYNQLMNYFALKGDVNNVLQLYEALKMDSIVPNSQTFAYLFEVFGRNNNGEKHKATLDLLKSDMETYQVDENDVFTKSFFENDRESIALSGIRLVNPGFTPMYPAPITESNCNLVKDIEEMSNSHNTMRNQFTIDELHKNMLEQLEAECKYEVTINSVTKKEDNLEARYCKKLIESIEQHWEKVVRSSFQRNLRFLKTKEQSMGSSVMFLHPFMEVLEEQEYVDVIMNMIREMAMCSDGYGPSRSRRETELATKVYRRYLSRRLKDSGSLDSMMDTYKTYLHWYLYNTKPDGHHSNNINHRVIWQLIEYNKRKSGTLNNMNVAEWPSLVLRNIGQFLLNIILNSVKISGSILKNFDLPGEMAAFYTVMRPHSSCYCEQLKAHPVLSRIYHTAGRQKLYFSPTFVPSFNVPVPRTSITKGIYFILDSDFIRPQEGDNSNYINEHPVETFYPVMDALNDLGTVPWTINGGVLDVVIQVFQNGGSEELDVPLSAEQFDLTPPAKTLAHLDKPTYKAFFKKEKSEMYSLWCDALYRLSIANHFRDRIFWLPHNLDFRGRAYTVAPYLSHLAGDLGRSLLLFGEKKPLGSKGLEWLKIHIINLTGIKKMSSLTDRMKYADEIIDDILDSAANPLTGKMWWTKSEEPWQTLAACMELASALKHPNPEEYESGFPLHQDGSCNGLQHYAALGRDVLGAKSVNLHPSEIPQDVYSAIARIVEERRVKDANNGVLIAKQLEGHVERKVIKQTIMTTVYGVTKFGSKLQIHKQLKERDLHENEAWHGSMYLADQTFKSIGTVFQSATEIQKWLVQLSQIISKEYGNNMHWRTPLNLPVLQVYQKRVGGNSKKQTEAHKQELRPDTRKQKNAFAPNFIHSLDSTHMMLTCLESHKKGITFVAIHDCFWTHACSVDTMNKICREKFVALHSEPILENLAKDILAKYSSTEWEEKMRASGNSKALTSLENHTNRIPKKGEFDIKNVLSSVYFFS